MMDKHNEFGIIVFSFGSLVSMNSLPENILDALKLAFSQLPQTILWKYEKDHMPNKPKNVILCKWLLQRDILRKLHNYHTKIFSIPCTILRFIILFKNYLHNNYVKII